jgi:hypothetical protein
LFVHLGDGCSCTCFHPRDGSFAPQYLWTECLLSNHWLLMVFFYPTSPVDWTGYHIGSGGFPLFRDSVVLRESNPSR